ncbi:uncharacterized protein An12g05780 [Aspergillus niger]|uniref:Contig An12c0160, genomic contig n=2 Tax=Aspergillus niger TaxID=5061 RepID=A2QZQ4_ASPNC|nr:uncharacterized protein An12g05780 [Aspergillus niger]CAK46286.1 unnamed protein product [Aspergillus niger]
MCDKADCISIADSYFLNYLKFLGVFIKIKEEEKNKT